MKKALLIIISILAVSGLFAFKEFDSAMGFHFGTSTGSGYSMRYWGEMGGIQGTISAYTYGNNKPKYDVDDFDDVDYKTARKQTGILGLSYLLALQRANDYHFYIICGGSYTVQKVKRYYLVENDIGEEYIDSKWKNKNQWTIGAGPGFELVLSDRFHLSAELPLTYNYKNDLKMHIPAVGFYYYFK